MSIKNTIVNLLCILVIACNFKSVNENSIQVSIRKYYQSEIERINNDQKSKFIIDSIIVISIDTLTEESLLKLRYNTKSIEIAKYQYELSHNIESFSANNTNEFLKLHLNLPIDTTTKNISDSHKKIILKKIDDAVKFQDSIKIMTNTAKLNNTITVAQC